MLGLSDTNSSYAIINMYGIKSTLTEDYFDLWLFCVV